MEGDDWARASADHGVRAAGLSERRPKDAAIQSPQWSIKGRRSKGRRRSEEDEDVRMRERTMCENFSVLYVFFSSKTYGAIPCM